MKPSQTILTWLMIFGIIGGLIFFSIYSMVPLIKMDSELAKREIGRAFGYIFLFPGIYILLPKKIRIFVEALLSSSSRLKFWTWGSSNNIHSTETLADILTSPKYKIIAIVLAGLGILILFSI